MVTRTVDPETRACIERALEALGAEEPDEWVDRTMAHLAARDPEPARAARPEVVEAANRLRHHPVLAVPHCEGFVTFLALAPFSTGVLVIPGTKRKPASERQGGVEDLFVTENPDDSTGLWPHMDRLFSGSVVRPTYAAAPLFGDRPGSGDVWDPLKRMTFCCPECGSTRPVKNVTLLRYFFEAVLQGADRVRLFPSETSHRIPKEASPEQPPQRFGLPFELAAGDEEDGALFDAVYVPGREGPIDLLVPDAIVVGVDAVRAAKELGCSPLAAQVARSAFRAAALGADEAAWREGRGLRLSATDDIVFVPRALAVPDEAMQSAIDELKGVGLWPWMVATGRPGASTP